MIFESKIFIPSNKRFSTWSITEKCYSISVLLIIIFGIALMLFDFTKIVYPLKLIFITIVSSSVILLFISMLGPFYEQEPLYGIFSEKITIKENGIIYKNQLYAYQDFRLFDISIKSFYYKKTGNSRLGPKYFQGINNKLYFIANGITFHQYFLIQSEKQSEILSKLIDDAIMEEKIPFRNRYLYLISENSKTSTKYKDFVIKLKNEKRINTK